MNPWALDFSGIRDFKDTRLELGGPLDHVLIGGPNGSGKSTITFCLGAVLGSSKIDLEGLRSRNLPADQIWRATIELVFANTGDKPVDAAAYIAFRLNLEQKPGDPLRKEYWIYEGDQPREWHKKTRYTPGDGTNHLHEYRHQLQHKFKVDPDAFYLIWYQQDVNQFAVMRPEERFRIFSEMTGIERMQQNWEKVKEEKKESFSALQTAEGNQHQHKLNLGNWQQERDRLLSRNERRKAGLLNSMSASRVLAGIYRGEQEGLQERLEEIAEGYGDALDRKLKLEVEHKQHQSELEQKIRQKTELDQQLEGLETAIEAVRTEREQLNGEYRQLEDQLRELSEQVKAIPYSEADVSGRLANDKQQVQEAGEQAQKTEAAYREAQEQLDLIGEEIAGLNYSIAEDSRKLSEAEAMVAQYGASAVLEQEAGQLEHHRSELLESTRELEGKLQSLGDELRALHNNDVRSLRQDQSIRQLRGMGLTVYTLRDLLEMDEQVPLEREEQLEPVKYTLFVDAKGFKAPTDLYHVELQTVIPERTMDELNEFGLRVKKNLDDKTYAAAQKALWWVSELAAPSATAAAKAWLQGGQLIDPRGRRGPQEKQQWLLNPKGIALRIKRSGDELEKLERQLRAVREEQAACEARLQLIRSVVHSIKEAEKVIQAIADRDWRTKELERTTAAQTGWRGVREQAHAGKQALDQLVAELRHRLEMFEGYQRVYDQAREQGSDLERHRQLGGELEQLREKLQHSERELEDKLAADDQLERSIESSKRRVREKLQYIEDADKALEGLQRERRHTQERLGVVEESHAAEQHFYKSWTERLPQVWAELRAETAQAENAGPGLAGFSHSFPPVPDWNEAQAKSEKETATIQLTQACADTVDENALENYEKVRQEYERGQQEVQDARSLLQQLEDSLTELEEKLVSTTNYEVKRVHAKFLFYMDLFGFDGEVSWSMQELKRGNVKYYLNIRARKQGHRGSLEEVSVKGRGGKVGKGVSGGEESLSSLLFALALLKTIQAEPGYIILDEFDSALDEGRKSKVFRLYEQELARKMIILSPKSHESDYLQHFNEAFVVYHDARIPQSDMIRIKKKQTLY